uniref:RRM domain-containing protein n=1 Tax=Angiostrongylus cantonensis TaxID=6313 RepID=A0A0K0DBE5_ANGCA
MKRFRRDELADPTNPEPSLVVHVRNLNPKATEADLIEALGTFGLIAYVTVIPAQKMALVEFEDIEAARACVTFAASNLIFVAGDAALFNYSTSQNIQRLGKVLRIAIVRKSMMQALVEFENAENAKKVKHAINGADIYSGCCTLKVEFAKPDYVKVTRQDSDQWDYTLSEGGKGDAAGEHRTQRKTLLPGGGRRLPPDYRGDYGDYDTPQHYPPVGGSGCVVMIYGIDQEKLNCEMLFNLLCQYGNVLRIRFMATKRDTVMAELGTPMAVTNVLKYLQGITLFGLTLQMKPSIQNSVRDVHEPFSLPDGSPSFRDYSMSALQRFSTPDAAARNRLIYPTKILHWYNAPVNMDEDKVRQVGFAVGRTIISYLFSERSAPEPKSVTVFVGRSERSSSGTVEMETIESANEALALVNHTPVVSPLGKTPYIVKLAYATPSRRVGGDSASEDTGGGDVGSGFVQRRGFRGGPRGTVLEVVIGEGEVVDIVDHTRIRTSHVNRRNWLQFGHSSAMNSIIVYFRYLDVLDNHKEVRIRSFLKYFVSFFFISL